MNKTSVWWKGGFWSEIPQLLTTLSLSCLGERWQHTWPISMPCSPASSSQTPLAQAGWSSCSPAWSITLLTVLPHGWALEHLQSCRHGRNPWPAPASQTALQVILDNAEIPMLQPPSPWCTLQQLLLSHTSFVLLLPPCKVASGG